MDKKEALEIAVEAVKRYAESHQRPPAVTQRQVAKMINKSPTTVGKMVRAGIFSLNEAGMIPIHQVDRVNIGQAG